VLLKVCGVWGRSAAQDIEALAGAGADLVGLWHAVGGGEADLPASELVTLARAARDSAIEPVVVTFERDAEALARVVRRTGATWLQLHAFQLPWVVRALRRGPRGSELTIVKVLHVRGDRCVDLPLVAAYEQAGVDAFLLDVTTDDGRVGSTGRQMSPEAAASVAERIERPFLLAGGISARNPGRYAGLACLERFVGIDIGTGARNRDGHIDPLRVEAIDRAWRGGGNRERDVLVR